MIRKREGWPACGEIWSGLTSPFTRGLIKLELSRNYQQTGQQIANNTKSPALGYEASPYNTVSQLMPCCD